MVERDKGKRQKEGRSELEWVIRGVDGMGRYAGERYGSGAEKEENEMERILCK